MEFKLSASTEIHGERVNNRANKEKNYEKMSISHEISTVLNYSHKNEASKFATCNVQLSIIKLKTTLFGSCLVEGSYANLP